MTVETLMTTSVVTVRDTDPVALAQTQMKLGAMRHVPVVDDKHNLVGILSAKDVDRAQRRQKKKKKRVGECMTRQLITVPPSMPLEEAMDLMLEHQFGSLPVVGSDGHLMGIVTQTDFLRVMARATA